MKKRVDSALLKEVGKRGEGRGRGSELEVEE